MNHVRMQHVRMQHVRMKHVRMKRFRKKRHARGIRGGMCPLKAAFHERPHQ